MDKFLIGTNDPPGNQFFDLDRSFVKCIIFVYVCIFYSLFVSRCVGAGETNSRTLLFTWRFYIDESNVNERLRNSVFFTLIKRQFFIMFNVDVAAIRAVKTSDSG